MNRSILRLFDHFVVILAVVSYLELFKFTMIPYSVRMMSQFVVCALLAVLIIIHIIYRKEETVKMNFKGPVLFLLFGSIPSYFVAQAYHNQYFVASFYANHVLWFYLLYFYIHLYKISVKFILQLIIVIGLFSVVLYFLQYFAYPNMFLDIGVLEDRGTIRLFVAGMIFSQAAYFYFLNQFFKTNKIIFIVLSLLVLSIFILQGTRTMILALIFLTLLNLLLARRIRSRLLIAFAFALASFIIVLIFREIFKELTEVSSSQVRNMSGGIRIRSARFFLKSFMPGGWAYLFGNGNSGLGSVYDQKMVLLALRSGYYLSDIGIVGDYVLYGAIFTLAGIIMLVKSILFKISSKYQFLKYYILSQCFTLFVGGGILSGVDVIILMILYVFDVDRDEMKKARIQDENNISESSLPLKIN